MNEFLDASVICLSFGAIVAIAAGHADAKGLLAAAIVAALAGLIYRGRQGRG